MDGQVWLSLRINQWTLFRFFLSRGFFKVFFRKLIRSNESELKSNKIENRKNINVHETVQSRQLLLRNLSYSILI